MVEIRKRTARRVMTATEWQVVQEATRDTIAAGHMPGPDTWLWLARTAEHIASMAGWAAPALEDRHRYITYQGERLSLVEWSRRTGIRRGTLAARLRYGWTVEQALTTPLRLPTDRVRVAGRRRPPGLVAAIVADYQSGVSIADLAVTHHRHPSTVGRYLAGAGIPRVPQPPKPRRDVGDKEPELPPFQEADLFSLYAAGTHTSAELAAKFDIPLSAVYRAIKRSLANG